MAKSNKIKQVPTPKLSESKASNETQPEIRNVPTSKLSESKASNETQPEITNVSTSKLSESKASNETQPEITNVSTVKTGNKQTAEELRTVFLNKYDVSPIKEDLNVLNSLRIVMKDFTNEYILLTYTPSFLFTDINIVSNFVSVLSAFVTLYVCNKYKFQEYKMYLPYLCTTYFLFCYGPLLFEHFVRGNEFVFLGSSITDLHSEDKNKNESILVTLKQDPIFLYKYHLEIKKGSLINKEVCDVTELFFEDGIFDHREFTNILDRALVFKSKND
ncbi:hypothetical protein CDIK_0855 [Cucumispora dikerogammari]|nr:hypothetical protein CDIK_0855 [Cucumispora dikerogammari]